MQIALSWMNRYLHPGDVTADEAVHVLTHAGYPVEGRTSTDDGDTVLEVEITSNRGDLFSHIGCAREIAAARSALKRRRLTLPAFTEPAPGPAIGSDLALENRTPELCPLFTARLIRGVRVGPSPEWLVRWLEAVGQRSINNIVDVTNFITFEFGNPCHVFDLAKLAGRRLIVRHAHEGEALTTLDGKPRTLKAADLVVADAEGATSLAGVMGGHDSEVDDTTTDVVFEMATWDPVTVRTMARRLGLRTDASFRFERIVDPRTIDAASRRAVALIAELSGGVVAQGVLAEGAPAQEPLEIALRPSRCSAVMGVQVPAREVEDLLRGHEIVVQHASDDRLLCTPPAFRPDLTREIDLVEEVARTIGYDAIPMTDRIGVRATHPQEAERARRELGGVLTGLGFYETVTFSFLRPDHAAPWFRDREAEVRVDDERRGEEPTLRPSALPSLMLCRRANADAQVTQPGGVRLYELSAVFSQSQAGVSRERRTLAMLMDVPGSSAGKRASAETMQQGLRAMRGSVERVVGALAGPARRVTVEASAPPCAGWADSGHGRVLVEDEPVGVLGPVADAPLRLAGLDVPVMAAELDLDALLKLYPARGVVRPLPSFPPIDRDLSLVVEESTPWAEVEAALTSAGLEHFESLEFVGVFRSEQIGAGKKSVTARLRFRRPDGTLRREDVDPQMDRAADLARQTLRATIRSA